MPSINDRNKLSAIMVIECLTILAGAFPAAFGQTRAACEAQLRHLTVRDYAPILKRVLPPNGPYGSGLPRPVYVKSPPRLLFSQAGAEVYAVLPEIFDGPSFYLGDATLDVSVLIVFQDEDARQAKIDQLRNSGVMPPPGFGALITNLKYEKVVFRPSGIVKGNSLADYWHISHVEFDQPADCDNVFQNDVHPSIGDAYSHTVDQIAYTDESKDAHLSLHRFNLSEALRAELGWIGRYIALTGVTSPANWPGLNGTLH
jgi:hypothetical protein